MLFIKSLLPRTLQHIIPLVSLLLVPFLAQAQSDDAARFLGYWAVTSDTGETHYLLVKREGEATYFAGDSEETIVGNWQLNGNRLVISYPSGLREVLSSSDEGFQRNAYQPGTSIDSEPDNYSRARRVSRKEVGEITGTRAAATVTLDPDILLERLLGFWQVADEADNPYFIEVRRFGRATRFDFDSGFTRKIETRGTWEILPDGLHIIWDDSSQDVLRIRERDLEKATFTAGSSIMSKPTYTSNVAKASFNSIDEVLDAAVDAKRQATLAQMAKEAAEKQRLDEAQAAAQRQEKLAALAAEAERNNLARKQALQDSSSSPDAPSAATTAQASPQAAAVSPTVTQTSQQTTTVPLAEASRELKEIEPAGTSSATTVDDTQEKALLEAERQRIEEQREKMEAERLRAEAERIRREQEAERRLAEAKIRAAELARERGTAIASEEQRRMEEAQKRIQEAERIREQERALAEAQRQEAAERRKQEEARLRAELDRLEKLERIREEAESQRQIAAQAASPNSGAATAAGRTTMSSEDITELYARKAALLRERAELEIEGQRLMELDRRMKAGTINLDNVDPSVRNYYDLNSNAQKPVVVLEETFDQMPLDNRHWSSTAGYHPMQTQQMANFKPGNASIVKGKLTLTAYLEGIFSRNQPNNYSSAIITGAGKLLQGFGLYEFQVQVPEGRGLHSQISLISNDGAVRIGVLDVLGQQPDTTRFSLVVPGQAPREVIVSGVDLSRGSHVVSVDCSPQGIVLFIDYIQRAKISANLPQTLKLYPAIALNVGSELSGPPNGWTNFPASMEIDSLRIYRN